MSATLLLPRLGCSVALMPAAAFEWRVVFAPTKKIILGRRAAGYGLDQQ
jgi:hypothetical protein